MFCRKCGKEIPDDSEFCYKCGARVVSIDDNSKENTPSIPVEGIASLTVENPKISLDKPEITEEQVSGSAEGSNHALTPQMPKNCPLCGKPTIRNRETCPYCGEEYLSSAQPIRGENVNTTSARQTQIKQTTQNATIIRQHRTTLSKLWSNYDDVKNGADLPNFVRRAH